MIRKENERKVMLVRQQRRPMPVKTNVSLKPIKRPVGTSVNQTKPDKVQPAETKELKECSENLVKPKRSTKRSRYFNDATMQGTRQLIRMTAFTQRFRPFPLFLSFFIMRI